MVDLAGGQAANCDKHPPLWEGGWGFEEKITKSQPPPISDTHMNMHAN